MLEHHFNNSKIADLNQINKFTRLKQQHLILELFKYYNCDTKERQKIEIRARRAAAVCSKPVYIFREIIHYLHEQRIVSPGYSFMQKTVSESLIYEQNRLITIIQDHLKQSDIEALKQLLEDSPGLYEITQLKREPKNFSVGEIKREIDRCKKIQPLYRIIQKLLPELSISNENVKYYASLMDYYSVYKLKRLNKWIVYVYY